MDRFIFFKKYIKGKKLLDIGCLGPHGNRFKFLNEAFPDKEIFGIDNNKELINTLNLKNIIFSDIHKLPFEDKFFDTVYMGEIIEHTWNPGQVIDEVFRVLKDDGRFILDTPNALSIQKLFKYTIFGKDDIVGDPDHRIIFTPITIYNLLQESGFKILDLKFKNVTSFKGHQVLLPNFGPFKWLGAQVLLAADKVGKKGEIELQLSVKKFLKK